MDVYATYDDYKNVKFKQLLTLALFKKIYLIIAVIWIYRWNFHYNTEKPNWREYMNFKWIFMLLKFFVDKYIVHSLSNAILETNERLVLNVQDFLKCYISPFDNIIN